MTLASKNTKLENSSHTQYPFRDISLRKSWIYLNDKAEILDCNTTFLNLIKSRKKRLLGLSLSKYSQNAKLCKAILNAISEGISTFHGEISFGSDSPEVYVEALLFSNNQEGFPEVGVNCYFTVIKIPIPVEEEKNAPPKVNSISEFYSYHNASVTVHAVDGKTIYVSPSIESLLGYTGSELKMMEPLDPVYPEDRHIIIDAITKLNDGIDFLNTRYRMIHKTGTIIPVESFSYLITDESVAGTHIVNVTWDLSSESRIERALARSEQKYYRLVMNLPSGIALISAEGILLEANDAMKEIMGLAPHTRLPDINFFSITQMMNQGIGEQLKKCIETREIVNGEIPFLYQSNNKKKFLIYRFLPIVDQEGKVDNVIGYVSDVTEQRKIETDTRERAEFLDLVINTIKSPFFVKDEDHRWVMLNDAAIEMMGQPRESLLGKSDYDLFPKEQADVFWKYDELVFQSGSYSNEEQITWSDGVVHTIVTHKQLYVEKPSGRKFIVGTIHDISSYKKIEEELRSSERKYHELFDNANDYILTVDPNGNITNANRTLLNYLQTDLQSLTQRNVFEFVHEDNRDFALDIKDKILQGIINSPFDIKAIGNNGLPVIYEVRVSLINRNDNFEGVQCVFSDVTERRESNLRLEKFNKDLLELNRTKDKFFSIIAHDLRNPYSSLLGFSELLLEDLEKMTTDEIRDYLKIIRNSAKNSLNLLENLLAWSRLETGRMPFDPAKVVLSHLVDEVVNVLYSFAYRKKIEVDNQVEPGVVLFADQNMLKTILNNLIMNALKYTGKGGEVKIFTGDYFIRPGSEKEFVTISVADTGTGMEPGIYEKLFVINQPVSSPGTENEQGTGLGLLLTREMVEKHGGSITAESKPGHGTVFSFTIPVLRENVST